MLPLLFASRWRFRSVVLLCIALLPTGCRQDSFNQHPDGFREFAYVANRAGNTVTILDLVYLRTERTLRVGVAPVALAVNPVRDEVYVVNAQTESTNGSLSVIDAAHNQVVATIPVHHAPLSISVEHTGHRAYIANSGSDSVSVVDLDTRREIGAGATGERPGFLIISPDGRTLVVTHHASGSVSLFSAGVSAASTSSLVLRKSFGGCVGASAAIILPDSSKAFITCSGSNQVMAVGLAAVEDAKAAKLDSSLATDSLLALLDVGRSPTQLTLKPDGGEVFVSNQGSDSISEISTQTNEVGSTYSIGNSPGHGVVSSDNSALWVSNSGADSISLYGIDDGKFLSSLHTGKAPDALAFSADGQLLLVADTGSGDVAVIRTTSKLGPALLTILPAGGSPSAIVIKAMQAKP